MDDPILWQLLLQFCLIMVNAVFACAEIALISMSDTKLEKMAAAGDKRAKRLLALTKQPAKFLATIQVGITLAGFLGSAFAADNFSEKITRWAMARGVPIAEATIDVVSVVIITLILSFFTLVLGELVPKRIAMKKADTLALAMSGLILLISRIFAPVVWLLTRSTNGILRLLRINPETEDSTITEEEIRLMIDMGSARGTINASEKEIIHNVFEFDDISAAEIMTHRRYVTFLNTEDDDGQWEKTITGNRHSFYPVCDGDPDRIAGVLSAADYLRLDRRDRRDVMVHAVRPAQLVPTTVKADHLFRNMKKKRNHFALVIDEYGGMAGLVTMNDLLELLVGDLEQDSTAAPERPLIEAAGPGSWRISGAASLDRVLRETGRSLPVDQYDTFAGYVFSILGRIPADGEQPEIEDCGLKIRAIRIKDRRLEEALVSLAEEA
ncbi:MAG: hemolysin family protein [Treponema sp.]|jgi:putative hemolysin|nr:hemolysin family protein [Treponema sp.]